MSMDLANRCSSPCLPLLFGCRLQQVPRSDCAPGPRGPPNTSALLDHATFIVPKKMTPLTPPWDTQQYRNRWRPISPSTYRERSLLRHILACCECSLLHETQKCWELLWRPHSPQINCGSQTDHPPATAPTIQHPSSTPSAPALHRQSGSARALCAHAIAMTGGKEKFN